MIDFFQTHGRPQTISSCLYETTMPCWLYVASIFRESLFPIFLLVHRVPSAWSCRIDENVESRRYYNGQRLPLEWKPSATVEQTHTNPKQNNKNTNISSAFHKLFGYRTSNMEKDGSDGRIYEKNASSLVFICAVIYCFHFYCAYETLEWSSNRASESCITTWPRVARALALLCACGFLSRFRWRITDWRYPRWLRIIVQTS